MMLPVTIRLALLATIALQGGYAELALAANEGQPYNNSYLAMPLEDLLKVPISTGARFEGHAQHDSPLPVVSFSADDLQDAHAGTSDLNMVLRDLLPSFNYLTEPLNDGSSHVRAFSLRGLPGDETLVLMNGKRLHNSALVQVASNSPITRGSEGVDLSQIPVFGLKRVEVLRDGASAQYGSDAIAGVVNLILADQTDGTEIQVQQGSAEGGTGNDSRVSINTGTHVNDNGFINVTGEYVHKDELSRGTQRPDAAYYASQGVSVADPAQIWGDPILDSARLLMNARVDLAQGVQAYWFGNVSNAHSDASFNYRALARSFFVNNLNTTDGSVVSCPSIPNDLFDYLTARNCLALADNNSALFNFQSWFPGGFTPRLAAKNRDIGQTLGINGPLGDSGGTYDVSFSYAQNNIDLRLRQTINPSLGPQSPTAFDLGSFEQSEKNLNADFVWPINTQLSLAAGAEWRRDMYEAVAGEPASWEAGPFISLGIGANGLPGIDPAAAGRFSRDNISAYIDSEYHLSDAWLLSAALRSEKYSDFGHTNNGKLSMRYLVTDQLSVRGSLGTGFRAPSPGQANLTDISHNGGTTAAGAKILVGGIIPPTSDIGQFFGARALMPERSHNLSLGMAYEQKSWSVTADAFRIRVDNRIELSDGITLTDAIRAQMQTAGITDADQYDSVSFFNNAANSISQGIDFSAAYEMNSRAGVTRVKVDISYLNTQVTYNGQGFPLSQTTLHNLAHQLPRTRGVFNVQHRVGDWKLTSNVIYYGATGPYPSKSITNLEANFSPEKMKHWSFTAGIGNVFNTQAYHEDASSIGSSFISENPFEYDGRRYYVTAKYMF